MVDNISANTAAWITWSAGETHRLVNLSVEELIISIQRHALVDLVESDQAKVLQNLVSKGGKEAVIEATKVDKSSRIPASLQGKGLPCGPSVRRRRPWLVPALLGLALGSWTVTLIAGHAWIAGRNEGGVSYAP